ncbi:glycosyltransferase [Vibrio splendidus]|uniref:glycosyltransferase n=1 Tax=Vibrio splendidus TaxID=29497 RepID=UPI00076A4660|nr:glycosyltransferase [Vibrio splendidus]
MSIVILTPHLHSGGVAKESRKCLNYLRDSNTVNVKIWCTDTIDGDIDGDYYFNFFSSRVHNVGWLRKLYLNLLSLPHFFSKLKENRTEYIIAMHFFPILLSHIYRLLSLRRVKVISVYHTDVAGYYHDAGLLKKIFIKTLISLSGSGLSSVFISKDALARAKKKFKLTNSVCIPNSVYFSSVIRKTILPPNKGSTVHLLAVGSLVSSKRIDSLLRVLKKLGEHDEFNFELKIAGIGDEEKRLKEFAIQLNIQKRVTFLGYTNDLKKYYTDADLLISTSEREGMPLNLLEAISHGTPVVAMDCNTGPREILEGNCGAVGYLCDSQIKEYNFELDLDSSEIVMAKLIINHFTLGYSFDTSSTVNEFSEEKSRLLWKEAVEK